jgi:hypothetical protein
MQIIKYYHRLLKDIGAGKIPIIYNGVSKV